MFTINCNVKQFLYIICLFYIYNLYIFLIRVIIKSMAHDIFPLLEICRKICHIFLWIRSHIWSPSFFDMSNFNQHLIIYSQKKKLEQSLILCSKILRVLQKLPLTCKKIMTY